LVPMWVDTLVSRLSARSAHPDIVEYALYFLRVLHESHVNPKKLSDKHNMILRLCASLLTADIFGDFQKIVKSAQKNANQSLLQSFVNFRTKCYATKIVNADKVREFLSTTSDSVRSEAINQLQKKKNWKRRDVDRNDCIKLLQSTVDEIRK